VANTTILVAVCAFSSKIADPSVGGTFVTALGSMYNVGDIFGSPLALFMVKFVDFGVLNVIGLGYEAVFYGVNRRRILVLQEVPKSEWVVGYREDKRQMLLELQEREES